MALDGLTIYSIKTELNQRLINGKIDKIMQPEKDEIHLIIRNNNKNYKLLISASPSFPRIYLTKFTNKTNPLKAPVFLMILRKYLLGGKIIEIRQDDCDRTLYIDILSLNELKEQTIKTLCIEIMGKHSNIILIEKNINKIIDSIKRVPMAVSSYRQILPNTDYIIPPKQDKVNPMDNISIQQFENQIKKHKKTILEAIYSSFYGLSPIVSREICHLSSVDENILPANLNTSDFEKIYLNFKDIINLIKNHNINPNIIIDEDNGKIVDFSPIKLSIYKKYTTTYYDTINEVCEHFYHKKDLTDRLNQKTHDIKKILSNKISSAEKKIQKQTEEINQTLNMGKYKHHADLLTSYIYMISQGQSKIEVIDFYDENSPKITINLDTTLSPSKNIQRLYKRYNKLKSRKKELTIQIQNTKDELEYLYNLEQSINNVVSDEDIDDIYNEMITQKIIRKKGQHKKNNSSSKPLHFVTKNGDNIYVGKNNTQNDYLTLKFANKNDIWFHVKNIPGSHVIVKSNDEEIAEDTILNAANLAAYYSKSRQSANVPVDYTTKSNIKKTNGARPGMVIYSTNSTIYITPDKSMIKQLKQMS